MRIQEDTGEYRRIQEDTGGYEEYIEQTLESKDSLTGFPYTLHPINNSIGFSPPPVHYLQILLTLLACSPVSNPSGDL